MKKKYYGILLAAVIAAGTIGVTAQAAELADTEKLTETANVTDDVNTANSTDASVQAQSDELEVPLVLNQTYTRSFSQVGQKYYFFGQINGGAGYMRTSARINGIQIRKDGSASYNRTQLQKLNLMVRANQIVDGITNNRMTKPQKLRACFRYIVNYNYGDGGDFAGGSNWDIYYGSRVLSRRRGDCFGFGCAFAYLADAVGYTSYAVSSGGHGWAEVNGRVYDANWAKATGRIDWYCGMDYNLSGRGGRPNYKPNRVYVKRI